MGLVKFMTRLIQARKSQTSLQIILKNNLKTSLKFHCLKLGNLKLHGGWSGGAKVLCKLSVPGRPTILITVGQGPTALAVGAGGGCLDIFTLLYPFSSLSPSLWETA